MSSSFLANDPVLARISRHDRSFCALIDCIPRSLYRAVEEDEDVLNAKYFKHKRAPMTADERKNSRKQRRRETYGLVDEEGEADKGRAAVDGDDSDGEEDKTVEKGNKKHKLDPELSVVIATTGSATFSAFDEGELLAAEGIESLKQRLKDKINQLKQGRGRAVGASGQQGQPPPRVSEPPRETPKSVSSRELARKLNLDLLQDMMLQPDGSADFEGTDSKDSKIRDHGEDLVEDVGDVDFSGIVDGRAAKAEALRSAGAPNPAGSKTKKLKRLVEEAKKKRQRMEELKAAGKSGEEQAASEAWSDVLREAAGDKVLTNTKRLVKALKRREKQKEKSAAEWQNRVDAVNMAKNERIEKREQNIKARKTGGAASSTSAGDTTSGLAVSNRAGFEGRKRGFLNEKNIRGDKAHSESNSKSEGNKKQ